MKPLPSPNLEKWSSIFQILFFLNEHTGLVSQKHTTLDTGGTDEKVYSSWIIDWSPETLLIYKGVFPKVIDPRKVIRLTNLTFDNLRFTGKRSLADEFIEAIDFISSLRSGKANTKLYMPWPLYESLVFEVNKNNWTTYPTNAREERNIFWGCPIHIIDELSYKHPKIELA